MATRTMTKPARADEIVTDAERDHFRAQGFVLPKVGLPAEDAAFMREAVERVLRENADWHNLLRMPHLPKRPGQPEGVVGGEDLFRIAIHPTIIAAAARLIGPNLIMWGGEIFAKPPGIGKGTPWHQDTYTPAVKAGPGRAFAQSVMIWIAVDDVDRENGCLRFIPGSGRKGRVEHGDEHDPTMMLNYQVKRSEIDESTAVDAILPSGRFSAHDLHVVHGANPNVSGRRRAGLTFHYMAAEDYYDRSFGNGLGTGIAGKAAPIAQRPIWLVLGENRCAGNDFVTGHVNLEDYDALAEARRQEMTALLGG